MEHWDHDPFGDEWIIGSPTPRNASESAAEVLGSLLSSPGVSEETRRLIQARLKARRPLVRNTTPTSTEPAVVGFSVDGTAGTTQNAVAHPQQVFRAEAMHATDWIPDMAPVDPDFCGFYLERFARDKHGRAVVLPEDCAEITLPSPKEFDVVDRGGDNSVLDLLGLGDPGKPYRAKFYPPPGASTRIVGIFVGNLPQRLTSTPTSAFSQGFVPFEKGLSVCQPALFITIQVYFHRTAHFEGALKGLVIR